MSSVTSSDQRRQYYPAPPPPPSLQGHHACPRRSPLHSSSHSASRTRITMASAFIRLAARPSAAKFLPRFATSARCLATTSARVAEAEYQRTTLSESIPNPSMGFREIKSDVETSPENRKIRHYTVNFVRHGEAGAAVWCGGLMDEIGSSTSRCARCVTVDSGAQRRGDFAE